MIKWFLYIVLLMIFVPRLSSANNAGFQNFLVDNISLNANYSLQRDTVSTRNTKHQTDEEKKKIKEIAKARKLPKPEKVEDTDHKNTKPKRQRRPDGLERPPEIPRRNNN